MEGMKGRGGEVRKVNVVYFISRDGKVEHPHLIRVHQFHSHGVHLHDVKRWLSALRGDGMPDLFAWSYKRRYKDGYVWQDLTDDDLITPISDNEYILKGSELIMKIHHQVDQFRQLDVSLSIGRTTNSPESGLSTATSPPPPPPIHDTSDEASIASLFSNKDKKDVLSTENDIADNKNCSIQIFSGVNMEHTHEDNTSNFRNRSSNKSDRKASKVLRNLMHCGTVDICDSTLRPIKRPVTGRQVSVEVMSHRRSSLGGDARYDDQKQHEKHSTHAYPYASRKSSTRKKKEKNVSAQPAVEPQCSQCGKRFKPDKLHAHMKSCKVLREKIRTWKRI